MDHAARVLRRGPAVEFYGQGIFDVATACHEAEAGSGREDARAYAGEKCRSLSSQPDAVVKL